MTHLFTHVRRNALACVAAVLALGAGGGYALAATNAKTITVCADKKTGVLHLHSRGRCKGSQTRISWNQQGLPGPQGKQGPAGQPGAPAASAWAIVTNSGTVLSGQGLAVQRASAGTYQVSVTAPGCAQGFNAPVVSSALQPRCTAASQTLTHPTAREPAHSRSLGSGTTAATNSSPSTPESSRAGHSHRPTIPST